MGPSALSAGILAFVEGRTGRDVGDKTVIASRRPRRLGQ